MNGTVHEYIHAALCPCPSCSHLAAALQQQAHALHLLLLPAALLQQAAGGQQQVKKGLQDLQHATAKRA